MLMITILLLISVNLVGYGQDAKIIDVRKAVFGNGKGYWIDVEYIKPDGKKIVNPYPVLESNFSGRLEKIAPMLDANIELQHNNYVKEMNPDVTLKQSTDVENALKALIGKEYTFGNNTMFDMVRDHDGKLQKVEYDLNGNFIKTKVFIKSVTPVIE